MNTPLPGPSDLEYALSEFWNAIGNARGELETAATKTRHIRAAALHPTDPDDPEIPTNHAALGALEQMRPQLHAMAAYLTCPTNLRPMDTAVSIADWIVDLHNTQHATTVWKDQTP